MQIYKQGIYGLILSLCAGMVSPETPVAEAISKPNLEKTSQVLWANENQRLEAEIALEVMSRLAVANDRIVNIFGDEGAFVAQTDEHTGQVFIKPTPENHDKPLSLTIITENGLTQDLSLSPSQDRAATIILKSPYAKGRQAAEEALVPGFNKSAQNPVQEETLQWMRKAVLGELPIFKGKYRTKVRDLPGVRIKHETRYSAGPLWIDIFKIKNIESVPQELLEKHFYQKGDRAISLSQKIVAPKASAFLYVLVEH
jgi:type-F conjugative transfer system secretin TraK